MSDAPETVRAPRRCTVCASPRRHRIDAELDAGTLSLRVIAKTHSVSKDAVARHRDRCERASPSGVRPDGSWVPAFPGQRPPFQPGHTVTLRHGAFSAARVEPIAEALIVERLEDPATPWLERPQYRAALFAWARTEARCVLLSSWLVDHVAESPPGCVGCERCGPVSDALLKYEKTASNHRTRLGLDPLSHARLGRDIATGQQASMAALLQQLAAERSRTDGDETT